jgi:cytochrome c oxidase subunit I
VSIGGAILLVSVILYLVVMYKTFRGPKVEAALVPEVPIAESLRHPQLTPVWLDRFKPWLIAAGLLVLLSYGPQLYSMISNISLNSTGVIAP